MLCYNDASIEVAAGNIQWSVIQVYELAHEVLKDLAKAPSPCVPKLGNNTTPSKWNNHITIHRGQVTGSRKSTLEYLLCKPVAVAMPHPPLETDMPYTRAGGSIQADQASRLSHSHSLYKRDNRMFDDIMEEAVCGSIYAASIKPFKRDRIGM